MTEIKRVLNVKYVLYIYTPIVPHKAVAEVQE